MGGAAHKSMEPWLRDNEIEFYAHQVRGVRQMARMRNFLLADDMGLGKSLQAIVVFIIDVVMGKSETCIVVCPATLIGNWLDEWEKFTRIPAMTLTGTPAKRKKQLEQFSQQLGPRVLVLNYEKIKSHLDDLNRIGFDVAIFDEAHYIKTHNSARTKACLALRSRRSFMLTGTPMLNRVNELWPLMHKIKPNTFPKYWSFQSRYCIMGGWNNKQVTGTKNVAELNDHLADVMIRRMKSEVLDLPEVQYIERRVDMLPEQQKLYDQAEQDLELPDPKSATPMSIENALTKFLRLKQICGTTATITPGEDYSAKLDLAVEDDMELIEHGEKIVVFTQFRTVQEVYIERILAAQKASGITAPVFVLNGDIPVPDRQKTVKDWAATPGAAIIVCMLQVAKVGLNMTAARHGSFLDELWTPGDNQQAVDRLHRIGASETHPVQIRKYITRKTVETRVQAILRSKKRMISELIEDDPNWRKKLYEAMMEDEAA